MRQIIISVSMVDSSIVSVSDELIPQYITMIYNK